MRPTFRTCSNDAAFASSAADSARADSISGLRAREQREPRRGREDVVGRLAHVDVVVRVHAGVRAARLAEDLRRAVREHLVRVHVVRGAGAGLVDVHHELIAQAAGKHFVRGRDDRLRHAGLQPTEPAVGLGGAFLHEHGGGDEIGMRAHPADRKVLERARRLHAVVRGVGDRHFAE